MTSRTIVKVVIIGLYCKQWSKQNAYIEILTIFLSLVSCFGRLKIFHVSFFFISGEPRNNVIVMNWTNSSCDEIQHLSLTVEKISEKRIYIYIPSIIYTCILLIIGIPGNSTVFYIYFTRWKPSSTRVFIIALAVLDFTNCLFTLPFELANMLNPFTFDHSVLCKVFRFFTYTCNSGGALLLIAIALDRDRKSVV